MTITADGAAAELRPPTILVVEDEPLLRIDIADWLAAAGFRVLEAGTADEALVAVENGAPVDLILSDVQMPGAIDGLDLHRILSQKFPWIPVVLTSARPACAIDDDVPFIPKPFTPRAALRRLVQEMRRRSEPGTRLEIRVANAI